ncbi:MAG TPA: ABC transporter ATP-binding protein [Planctomycetota bacterium]|nr:ABC transporter ATP-binding protein [Planctomycetota bacterium]
MIDLIDVYKAFGPKQVLNGFTLHVERGETFVIIGRNGIGKTVTFKHIMGLMKPERGQVLVEGQDITKLRGRELIAERDKFGMVFQGCALLNWLTVTENVALPLRERTRLSKREIDDRVREKLTLMGLQSAGHLYPAECSGGMKKRAAVARAIVRDPEIILYDEPTAGLDPIMASVVNDLIIELRQKLQITAMVVTHDMLSAYRVADRIGMLSGGQIIEIGTPDQIRNSQNPIVRQFIEGRVADPAVAEQPT